eukprot:CAMPEP_0170601604 /NCGR_PEP_ID=MMETSP0224-20130122/17950_1 /TAXON_ID=285029 /ORGANISM="Togula jolla, Strain CCCM 725" /LENGTH=492 /DNA_ID=CAMNT_0010926395 /DNA_START=58 /DNA_END=1533 /DNA_ORIENTATION=-
MANDSDDSDWRYLAIFFILVAVISVGAWIAAGFVWLRSRNTKARAFAPRAAWDELDLEKGRRQVGSTGSFTKGEVASKSNGSTPGVPLELCQTLRGLLEEEITRGFQRSGITDRLEILEQKQKELAGSPADRELSKVDDRLERLERIVQQFPGLAGAEQPLEARSIEDQGPSADPSLCSVAEPPAPPERPMSPPPPPRPPCRDAETMTEPGQPASKNFGPTRRQMRQDEPELRTGHRDPSREREMAADASVATLRQQLSRRDAQTQELHKQLRECQQALWTQTLEARSSAKRLSNLVADPSLAPEVQAQELSRLQKELLELSGRLADAKSGEAMWSQTAKRLRAFVMQSENADEGAQVLKRHPAGEIFLAPPVIMPDEAEAGINSWDVGTSLMNPYATDSWPFEPNVLAQRCAAEPSLNQCEEEQEDGDWDSETFSDQADSPRIGAGLEADADAEAGEDAEADMAKVRSAGTRGSAQVHRLPLSLPAMPAEF